MLLIICVIVGYLVGSIPTAYIIVRIKSGIDLRIKGSTNIGALNVYTVTKSKWTGIIVGLLDALKGFLAVLIAWVISDSSFWNQTSALLGALIGHNYPVWLRFHGGRGLATAAGGLFGIGVAYTIFWCLLWFISFKFVKDVLKANLLAILITPFALIAVPSAWIGYVMICNASATDYMIFSFIMSAILLLSHLQPLRETFKSKRIIS